MERTIDKIVKQEMERAKAAPQLLRNVLPNPGAIELMWTRPDGGSFVAHVVIRAISPQAVAYCAGDLAQFLANEWLPRQAQIQPPPPVPPEQKR